MDAIRSRFFGDTPLPQMVRSVRHPSDSQIRRSLRSLVFTLVMLSAAAAAAHATTYYVDNQNPLASDSGPGTLATPYRTIGAAVSQRGGAGTTIQVQPGTYREQVSVSSSGIAGSPFMFQGTPGAIVDGSDDFGSASLWAPFSGSVFLASSVTWNPVQAFADGGRLAIDTTLVSVGLIPTGAFRYVAGQGLYVNLGGANPGDHAARVGRRSYGFTVSSRSWVTIAGFTVTRSDSKGIYVSGTSSNVTVSGNTVTFARNFGIHLNGATACTVANNIVSDHGDHGIYLSVGVTQSQITGNESFRNARPTVRAANGIQLYGSSGNRIEGNRLHDNQDTGLQINAGSNDNVSVQNVSWNNGDHGFDHLTSSGTIHIGDVAYGNHKDGFSIEGTSPGSQLYDCIAVENGLTTNEYDLWVDDTSLPGLVTDYNIWWNSTAQSPVKNATTIFPTIAGYTAASGNDVHGVQSNPRFVNPTAGDFHLSYGSPAIDDATSAVVDWPLIDFAGNIRFDDPATVNHGAGPVPYADRGAYEYIGTGTSGDRPPLVTAPGAVTVNEGAQLRVNVTASDPDGNTITSLTADLSGLPAGTNAHFTPGGGNLSGVLTWTPGFSNAGSYSVTFRAANALAGTATTRITVNNVDRAPVVTAPGTVRVNTGGTATVSVTAADPDGQPIASLTADLSKLPAGSFATFTTNSAHTTGTLTWVTRTGQAGTYAVKFTAANALSGSASTDIHVRKRGLLEVLPTAQSLVARPLSLSNAMPVPSAAEVTFALELPDDGPVDWSVFDVQGRAVWHESRVLEAGSHTLRWDGGTSRGARAGMGVYLVRVQVANQTFLRRIVRL